MSHATLTTSELDRVPLIKSPSFWVPKPTELPPDIHPLPEDVHAYFVYPHTIESHALSVLPSSLHSLQSAHTTRLHLLASHAESKKRAYQARMNQVAPGWSEGQVMQPVKKDPAAPTPSRGGTASGKTIEERSARRPKPAGLGGSGLMGNLLEDEQEGVPARAGSGRSDLLGGLDQVLSPGEMGDATLDKMRKDQMQDFVDGLYSLDSSLGGGRRNSGADEALI